jgi:CheY-like chemotaxis protein
MIYETHARLLQVCLAHLRRGFKQDNGPERGARTFGIIALTAQAITCAAEECHAAGMDAYLAKPIDCAQLQVCIERFLVSFKQPQLSYEATGSQGLG